MAASKAELWTQLSYVVKILDETFKYSNANAPNFISMLDTLTKSLEGAHSPATSSALNSYRNSLNSLVNSSSPLTALILELAKNGYSSRATSVQAALADIFKGMTAATETVKNRAWTHGTVTAGGSNIGTGTVYRLTKDSNNQEIEAGAIPGGVVKLLCTSDKNLGATPGNESFLVSGSGISPTDGIEYGTCPGGSITVGAVRSEDGKLSNSSFENYSGTGATLAFTSWDLTTPLAATVDTTIFFRPAPGGTTGTALEFTDDNTITQYIQDANNRLDRTRPTFLIARYRRKSLCDGVLTLRLGSKTNSVTLSTVTDATWYDLVIGVSDEDGWYDNFKEDSSSKGIRIALDLASWTTGSLLLDSVILYQPPIYDGKYYLVTAGQTDFLKEDYFTFTDSVSNTGRIQTTIARLFGAHLPHTSGSPTYADA